MRVKHIMSIHAVLSKGCLFARVCQQSAALWKSWRRLRKRLPESTLLPGSAKSRNLMSRRILESNPSLALLRAVHQLSPGPGPEILLNRAWRGVKVAVVPDCVNKCNWLRA